MKDTNYQISFQEKMITYIAQYLLTKINSWQDGFSGKFQQTFQKETMSISYNISQKIQEEGTLTSQLIL